MAHPRSLSLVPPRGATGSPEHGEAAFLPYGRHLVDDDDIAAVVAVLRGDFLTTGPVVEAFEEAFARAVGARYAVSCSSGTAGLHLAALALGLGPGDLVVVPAVTFLATANAARYVGAEVIFADVSPDGGLPTPETLRDAFDAAEAGRSERPKSIFPVHLNGQCVDMAMIAEVAAERGLFVVEDACHAIGATYQRADGETVPVGSCRDSDMTVFSLHPLKTITMGEGGVVTTNDERLYRRLRRLRTHGMVREAADFEHGDLGFDDASRRPNPWYYEMPEIGLNYRASDIHCALGLSQLGKLDRFVARRRALVDAYETRLARLERWLKVVERVPDCTPAWHLCAVLIDFAAAGVSRGALMDALRARGIATQVHYLPLHMQPYYRRRYGDIRLPGAERYYAAALSLPLYPGMTEQDVERVCDALDELLANPEGQCTSA